MKMSALSISCVFVLLISTVYSTNVAQCKATGKSSPVQTEVVLGECVDPPCELKKGTKTWVNMTFTADDNYPKLITNIFATMMGIKHGYPGLNGKSACPFLTTIPPTAGTGCPMAKGGTYMFGIELEVKKSFPKVSVPLHFAIKDEQSGKDVGCFETTIKIV